MSLLGYQKGEAKFAKFVLPEFRLPFFSILNFFVFFNSFQFVRFNQLNSIAKYKQKHNF